VPPAPSTAQVRRGQAAAQASSRPACATQARTRSSPSGSSAAPTATAVCQAGAGAGSGAPRKDSVDRAAAVLMADAAERAGVRRFVQVSSMGAGQPPQPGRDKVWAAYITAKAAAEADLRARDLDWTILRPGDLTDAPPADRIRLASPPVPAGTVPRADVAAVIAALLDDPDTGARPLS
jgi:uncharacterized protein YbjT (DUF2867 family)